MNRMKLRREREKQAGRVRRDYYATPEHHQAIKKLLRDLTLNKLTELGQEMGEYDALVMCRNCKHFNQKTYGYSEGDYGKCFKLGATICYEDISHAWVKEDFYCAFFDKEVCT